MILDNEKILRFEKRINELLAKTYIHPLPGGVGRYWGSDEMDDIIKTFETTHRVELTYEVVEILGGVPKFFVRKYIDLDLRR